MCIIDFIEQMSWHEVILFTTSALSPIVFDSVTRKSLKMIALVETIFVINIIFQNNVRNQFAISNFNLTQGSVLTQFLIIFNLQLLI